MSIAIDIDKKPVEVWPMHVDKYIQTHFLKEVSSMLIYEPSSKQFKEDGLYSETIFGQIGTPERLAKLGYIDLHTEVLTPHIYKNTLDVASWYEGIMKGTQYAIFDPSDNKFIPADRDTEFADTGFSFFMSHFKDCRFERNNSITRNDKISAIEKSQLNNTYKTSKLIVSPAGWRDIKIINDREEIEDINKYYTSLLALANEVNVPMTSPAIISFFNTIKYNIQLKVYEIFQYFKTFIEGKQGFGQEKYSKRYVAWGTRNVITTPSLIASSPNAPDYLKHDETLQPLYQLAVSFMPLTVHHLNQLFYQQIFTFGAINVPLIDKDTYKITYAELSAQQITDALSSESKLKFVQDFKNLEFRQEPVTIKDANDKEFYLWLVYDLDDRIYLFRNIDDLEQLLSDDGLSEDGNIPIKILDCPTLNLNNISYRWYSTLKKFKELFNIDLSYMQYKLSDQPLFMDGSPDNTQDKSLFAGCYTTTNLIVLNPNMKVAFSRYNGSNYTTTLNLYWKKVESLIAHELAHELLNANEFLNNYKDIPIVNKLIKEAEASNYETEYTRTIENSEVHRKEVFCEYVAKIVTDSKLSEYKVDRSKIHPLTNVEMLYIATFEATKNRFVTVTRYPCISSSSIYPTKPVSGSTSPSRVVKFKSQYNPSNEVIYPHYPVYGLNNFLDSLVIHPCKTAGLGAK